MRGIARSALPAAFAIAFASAGCAPSPSATDGGEPCATGFVGNSVSAPDFDFQVIQADQTVAPLADGGTVPILSPPQGGRVVFVGVRATNVDGCGLQVTGVLRDLATNKATIDGRTIDLVATGDGWGASGLEGGAVSADLANFTNVPVCPNEWSSSNVYGVAYGLEMTITDRAGRTLTKKIAVTPQCGDPATLSECLCICKGGYVLGESCADGGP